MCVMSATEKLAQPEADRERISPIVRTETALRLRIRAAVTGCTQGEILDALVMAYLPPPPADPVS
jgi:hypothetical protein